MTPGLGGRIKGRSQNLLLGHFKARTMNNIWEEFLSLHIVSKCCHFLGNFGALFEALLNWSHQNRNVPQFRNCGQSPILPLIGL